MLLKGLNYDALSLILSAKERRPKRAHNIFRRCIENPWFDRFLASSWGVVSAGMMTCTNPQEIGAELQEDLRRRVGNLTRIEVR